MKYKEWQIKRDGKVWSDRIDSEEEADRMAEMYATEYLFSEFEVLEMTEEEILKYEKVQA